MPKPKENKFRTYAIHIGLFILTFATTTIAGTEHSVSPFFALNSGKDGIEFIYTWKDLQQGMLFSIPFLLVLTVHEFGHYFVAKFHKVKTSLPYYIPLWIPVSFPIPGTMGAVIRIREVIYNKKQYFDIGIAGPLAGWVVAIGFMWYGYTHLPPQDHLLHLHPEYKEFLSKDKELDASIQEYMQHYKKEGLATYLKENPEAKVDESDFQIPLLKVGKNLTMLFFEKFVVEDKSRIPSSYEVYHYPFIYAGFLSLFFTFLNLLPIGQLDGGHILFGMIKERYHRISSLIIFMAFVTYASLGLNFRDWIITDTGDNYGFLSNIFIYLGLMYIIFSKAIESRRTALTIALSFTLVNLGTFVLIPELTPKGYSSWLFFAFILARVLGIYHPPTFDGDAKLDTKRKVLGWIAFFIFVISFCPQPFDLVMI
ncbi:MAG: site-2 protease family protein [Cytophagales bacterium]|nr:site-2 protease family protein [Cytophagales bacterium]